ncbi:MAG: hypothetical protein WCW40_10440 [Bacteroidota bacterium]
MMITRSKKILFSVFTALAFLLLLVSIEFLLRLTAPASEEFKQSLISDGIPSYQINRSYLRKYFPANAPILPELKPTVFRKDKTDHTFRIVCLGESSMLGTPFQLNTNIPGYIRKMLRSMYPEKEIEVINLGAAAINTNVILDLTDEVVDLQPDLILIYTGHNEFYGPDGVGASWLQKSFPATIPLKYAFSNLQLVKLFEKYIVGSSVSAAPKEYNLMKQVSQNSTVKLNSDDAGRIFQLFESNLGKLLSTFDDHRIPVIMSDVTSNLLFPPFAYDTSAQLQPYQKEFSSVAGTSANKNTETLANVLRLLQIDSTNAFLNYLAGTILLKDKRLDEAKRYLIRAKDEDLLKFRAPEQINSIVRTVAAVHNIPFISADSVFYADSPSGIPDQNLLYEHLHPNAVGYYTIASLFVKTIVKHRLISPAVVSIPTSFDSMDIPWLDLAFADLSMKRLTSQWPFQNYEFEMKVINGADETLKKIASDVYYSKIGLAEGCYRTATRFQQLGRTRDALATYAYLSEEYPYNYYPYYLSGVACKDAGMSEKAEQFYSLSLRYDPGYIFAHIDLGLLKINAGKFDEAIAHFHTADSVSSKKTTSPLVKATIYYGLSAACANKGDFQQAKRYIDESLRNAPGYAAAQELRRRLSTVR